LVQDKKTILLYGRTNAGKTAQIGALAEHVKKTLGKRTRLYTADKGGVKTIQPYAKLGIIEPVTIDGTDPWMFLNKAAKGMVRDAAGKWVAGDLSDIGLIAYEGFRSFAEELLMWLADKSAEGVNIGGGSNVAFSVTSDGETLKVGGSNQSHYKVVQDRMTSEIWRSQRLDVPYILWTSSVSKDDGTISAGKILGPDVIGKALAEETPRWFTYTYRIDVLPAQQGKPERHILYLGTTVDTGAGNATGLGNMRMPLDAPKLEANTIEPANIVTALELSEGGIDKAADVISKRMASK
jgi:hypothetical protein